MVFSQGEITLYHYGVVLQTWGKHYELSQSIQSLNQLLHAVSYRIESVDQEFEPTPVVSVISYWVEINMAIFCWLIFLKKEKQQTLQEFINFSVMKAYSLLQSLDE